MDEIPPILRLIRDMEIGEAGYIFPKSLEFDKDYVPYLDLNREFYSKQTGEAKIPILRTGEKYTDFRIDIRGVNYIWIKSIESYSDFDEIDEGEGLVRLEYEDIQKRLIEDNQRKRFPKSHMLRRRLETALINENFEEIGDIILPNKDKVV